MDLNRTAGRHLAPEELSGASIHSTVLAESLTQQLPRMVVGKIVPGLSALASNIGILPILNIFDEGVIHLIGGTDIDRARNAISLTHGFPQGNEPHTY